MKDAYPLPITVGSVLGSDGVGVVKKGANVGQRVLMNPGCGWDSDPLGPEQDYYILGLLPAVGTFRKELVIETRELAPCPEHLSLAEAAALPLAGLTAYRACFSKAKIERGHNVLVTGIGGGVAMFALQFAVAAGANVYVTSSKQEKISNAVQMGAKGGVNYKDASCMDDLLKLTKGAKIDSIIDGAGGPLYAEFPKVLKNGGIMVNYGQTSDKSNKSMTTSDQGGIVFTMVHTFGNYELKGSTMGSRHEFQEMVAFVEKHKIKPLVSEVFKHGFDESSVDKALDDMR